MNRVQKDVLSSIFLLCEKKVVSLQVLSDVIYAHINHRLHSTSIVESSLFEGTLVCSHSIAMWCMVGEYCGICVD